MAEQAIDSFTSFVLTLLGAGAAVTAETPFTSHRMRPVTIKRYEVYEREEKILFRIRRKLDGS